MKILLLGSGALQIGQAGEFDYSGSQAIKALKEEGAEVILINPNIATIQTSKDFADQVYFLPVEPHFVKEVIKKEKPDGILLSFGGQTALNCGLALTKSGVLKKYKVKVLGTPVGAIEATEDRHLFAKMLQSIDLAIPKSAAVKSLAEAKTVIKQIKFPIIVRAAFSLGGQDSAVCTNEKELEESVTRSLTKSPQVLIEEYLAGWKEIEYEVVRDKYDNCITVCNMENVDPMGIHTGESIVVAPSQTLNNNEYHTLRQIAIQVIRQLKIVGECNIQFALNPKPSSTVIASKAKQSKRNKQSFSANKIASSSSTPRNDMLNSLDYRIIEVNARLSRSSALASKATGYPLAYIAAKLALGYGLTELKNTVTKKTIAAFEPALDYIVVKFPRWDLGKFQKSDFRIGSYMQSVGEVMAVGRKFEEAVQKAVRMLDLGLTGLLDEKTPDVKWETPTPSRLFAVAEAIKKGVSIQKISKDTGIDPFFLEKIKNIVKLEKEIEIKQLSPDLLLNAKQHGFSDSRIAYLKKLPEEKVREFRIKNNIRPRVKQIDTLAAEYPAQTNYLYLTYNGEKDDIPQIENLKLFFGKNGIKIENSDNQKIIVLGSGPYRIGSSVEFDWCCVTCAQTSQNLGFSPIIINCNPETVSTDFDMAKKLYFEELSTETVMEIYEKEKPLGIIVSMGGQTPNNLVMDLVKKGANILGTSPASIDKAEDRNKFSSLCDQLGIDQPPWAKLVNAKDAVTFAKNVGFPVLVRPSYVLSGAAMNVAFNAQDLKNYLKMASNISEKYPVVISKYFENAKEIEIDAVANRGEVLTYAISEHVENAGVHSGDSTMVLPAQKIYLETEKRILNITKKIAGSLKITGPFNIQFLAKDNKVMVIECNLRASRSLPFASKVMGVNFVKVATDAILKGTGKKYSVNNIPYVGVKAPQFSFSRVKGADPILRVEMSSTGEVACFGDDISEAFLKSLIATGVKLPKKSVFISLAGEENKIKFLESARLLANFGLKIYATAGTSAFLNSHNIQSQKLHKIHEKKKPNVLNFLLAKQIDLVINIVDPYFKREFDDDYVIRRATVDYGVPLLTNLQTAELFAKSISKKKFADLMVLPWSSYVTHRN
ncbi:carbamoyl phosphate synthase large subunit [Candidatus Curtissbacteria bacterium RIFCSPHIGHO2_01_FULL_41_11]|uniref:Carbamoyl phosphate synthase large subunit n=1 Tax=Candidatus Curtissbacteria bacterium RIFCSPHIGHO2_01_FULL_41_11 TaxID=1797711 RepID=A0A1F5G5W5_9BACT|nr:MAG: carbamoyl phosphate synthase large subunit [Candidatus Curtissbacteria bacterium RIFCSPHIGHO2_01_FULL_41_11]